MWRNVKFLQIWQNFTFLHICCVEKSEIPLHVEKFQISPHLSCIEIWNFSTCLIFPPQIYWWQISGMLSWGLWRFYFLLVLLHWELTAARYEWYQVSKSTLLLYWKYAQLVILAIHCIYNEVSLLFFVHAFGPYRSCRVFGIFALCNWIYIVQLYVLKQEVRDRVML